MLAPYRAHVEPFCAIFWELFRPCTAFARNTVNTGKIYTFWSRSWWFLPPCFGYFCCSLFWYAALRLCLSDLGLLLGHPRLCQRHVGELGAYWLYFWAHWAMLDILSRVGTILGSDWAILGYFGVCVGLCLGTWTFHCRWIFVHASHLPKNTVKTRESNDFLGCVAWWSLLLFCFFLLGYAAHRLCLPDLGLILGHSRLCQCHIDLMLGHFGLFCGLY